MQTQNALKKIAKLGLEVTKNKNKYTAKIGSQLVSFFDQDGSAIIFHTCKERTAEEIAYDSYTDYNPSIFHDNLKQALEFAQDR
jgi:hypothetical protein